MKNNEYKILSEDAIKYLCGLIRDLASVSEGIDNLNLADNKTFSNIYIKNLIDKCLEDANAEAEKLVGALTHLTCEETAIQPTLDNSEINVIYLYSANGNPPYQQFLKISEDKLVDLGSTSISLEDYIKAADVAKDYATKVELKAVTDKIGTTTLTTTDTTITGAIEEVKGIAEGKAEILDSEKNDVNTWSSNKIAEHVDKKVGDIGTVVNGESVSSEVFKETWVSLAKINLPKGTWCLYRNAYNPAASYGIPARDIAWSTTQNSGEYVFSHLPMSAKESVNTIINLSATSTIYISYYVYGEEGSNGNEVSAYNWKAVKIAN